MSDEDSRALRKLALSLLARREHSRAELCRKLVARGHAQAQVEQELDRLIGDRCLDDSRYAEAYASSRASRGFGPARIRGELGARGVARVVVDAVLAGMEIDWVARARAARHKKFGKQPVRDARERARQARHLGDRGFEEGQIRQAFERGEGPD